MWPMLIGLGSYAPMFLAGGVAFWWFSRLDPADVYEQAFNTSPSPTVQIQFAQEGGSCDSQEIELRFTATPADIRSITGNTLTLDLNYATQRPSTILTSAGGVPNSACEIYTGGSYDQRFSSADDAVLIYYRPTGEAWYSYLGVD